MGFFVLLLTILVVLLTVLPLLLLLPLRLAHFLVVFKLLLFLMAIGLGVVDFDVFGLSSLISMGSVVFSFSIERPLESSVRKLMALDEIAGFFELDFAICCSFCSLFASMKPMQIEDKIAASKMMQINDRILAIHSIISINQFTIYIFFCNVNSSIC